MRIITVLSHTVDISKPLSLNSLTSYGRLDVICRCITSTFYLSNNFRKDVILKIFFLQNNKLMVLNGNKVKGLNPDERAVAGVLRKVFSGKKFPGIEIESKNLDELMTEEKYIVLDREGHDFEEIKADLRQAPYSFLIGDQVGFPDDVRSLIQDKIKLTLGKIEYLSSQTITILHYLLDQIEISD
ncbi:MAG: hypothetical protein ACTSR2_12595 [Candidatus Hodarchaeales archaeon]